MWSTNTSVHSVVHYTLVKPFAILRPVLLSTRVFPSELVRTVTVHSNILDHAMQTGHRVMDSSFSIVCVGNPDLLRISESIQILENLLTMIKNPRTSSLSCEVLIVRFLLLD